MKLEGARKRKGARRSEKRETQLVKEKTSYAVWNESHPDCSTSVKGNRAQRAADAQARCFSARKVESVPGGCIVLRSRTIPMKQSSDIPKT